MKLNPKLMNEPYAFVNLPNEQKIPDGIVALFKENEGLTAIMKRNLADDMGLPIVFEAAWIILTAETDLNDVGLTATFSRLLSDNGISCNVFAPIHHDHIFVPWGDGAKALRLLKEMEWSNENS